MPASFISNFEILRLGPSRSSASLLATRQEFAGRFEADDLFGAQADELLGALASDFQFVGHWSCPQLDLVYASGWSQGDT